MTQTVVVREFIISLHGNELSLGLFFGAWLFWVGLGALCSHYQGSNRLLPLAKILYPVFSIIQVLLFIAIRYFLNISQWQMITLDKSIIFIIIATAPLSLLTGYLFVEFTSLLQQKQQQAQNVALTLAYILESAGSFIAGIIATIFFLNQLPPFLGVCIASLCFSFSILLDSNPKQKISKAASLLLTIIFALSIVSFNAIQKKLIDIRHQTTFNIGESIDDFYTPYRQVNIRKTAEQTLVISDGKIISTIPDETNSDKTAAMLLSTTNSPKNILLTGIGSENLIYSILKYKYINSITYVIEDKDYYANVKKHLPQKYINSLNDQRLSIVHTPIRTYLKTTKKKFDLISSEFDNPSTLSGNRYYTSDFIKLCRRSLSPYGCFAFKLTLEDNIAGTELLNYASSCFYTLSNIFRNLIISPEKTQYFIASDSNINLNDDNKILMNRYRKIAPSNSTFPAEGFYSIFNQNRIKSLIKSYRTNTTLAANEFINTDKKPLIYLFNNIISLKLAGYTYTKLPLMLFKSGQSLILLLIGFIFVLRFLYIYKNNIDNTQISIFNIKTLQFISGFCALSTYIICLYLFQNTFGQIIAYIGTANALYMIGLCFGSLCVQRLINKKHPGNYIPTLLVILQTMFLLLVSQIQGSGMPTLLSFSKFMLFFFIAGALGGASYPICAYLLKKSGKDLRSSSIILELLDHWGASISGFILSLLLLPSLGITNTIFILCSLLVLLLILFIHNQIKPSSETIPAKQPHAVQWIFLAAIILVSAFSYALINFEQSSRETKKTNIIRTFDYTNLKQITGYNGPINLEIILDNKQTIKSVSLLQNNETPSYISNINKFLEQFVGYDINSQFDNSNIDAMSGATISSNAITQIVNQSKTILIPTEINIRANVLKNIDSGVIALALLFMLGLMLKLFLANNRMARLSYLALVTLVLGFKYNTIFTTQHIRLLLVQNIFTPPHLLCLAIILLCIFLGRFYCGFLCPFGAIQELFSSIPFKVKISEKVKLQFTKFPLVILALFIISVVIAPQKSLHINEPLINAFVESGLDVAKLLVILLLFISSFITRFWCRFFCPVGAFLSTIARLSIPMPKRRLKHDKTRINIRKQETFCVCNDSFFYGLILITLAGLVFINLPKKQKRIEIQEQVENTATKELNNAPVEKIKRLIKSGRLSNKESMYYKKIETSKTDS